MPRVISIHEYALKPGVDPDAFETAVRKAWEDGLVDLPGLQQKHFLKGLRGHRAGGYTAIWVYESREAWERLWGPVDARRPKEAYPENWKVWEEQILRPFLNKDPDKIAFTAYEEL